MIFNIGFYLFVVSYFDQFDLSFLWKLFQLFFKYSGYFLNDLIFIVITFSEFNESDPYVVIFVHSEQVI